jgi:tetratricopeptide (TPR) repeat protein
MVLDLRQPEFPRPSTGNDISFFFRAALELTSIEGAQGSISVKELYARLIEETKRFDGVDGLLVGMDLDHEQDVRRKFIARSERSMNSDPAIAQYVRRRVLRPLDRAEWDTSGARSLARSVSAGTAELLYDVLSQGIIDKLVDDLHSIIRDIVQHSGRASHIEEVIIKSGLLGEIAFAEAIGRKEVVTDLVFELDQFPSIKPTEVGEQIMSRLIARRSTGLQPQPPQHKPAKRTLRSTDDYEIDRLTPSQRREVARGGSSKARGVSKAERSSERRPTAATLSERRSVSIVDAIERFIDRQQRLRQSKSRQRTTAASLESVDREINWIEERLREGDAAESEIGLIRLIDYQSERSRREHLLKSLTRIADSARKARLFEFSAKVFAACSLLGGEDSAARGAQAELLRDLGRSTEALAAFDETIRMFPRDVVPRAARAEVLRDLNQPQEALAALNQTINLFPHEVVPRAARAEVLRELGRPREALAALNETVRLFPRDAVPRTARAEVLRELGQSEQALAALNETIRLFPAEVVPRAAQAEVLRDLGQPQEALASLNETITLFPQAVVPRCARAEVLRELGQAEEALEALNEIISLFPYESVPRSARAEVLRELGQPQEALVSLNETIRLFPRDVVPRTARAEVLRELGKSQEALSALNETIRLFPREVVPRNVQAEVLRELGRPQEALATFNETMRLFPHNDVVRTAYADLLSQLGRHEDVVKFLGKVTEGPRTRDDWKKYHVLAVSYLRAKRLDDAVLMLENGRNKSPFRDTWSYFDGALAVALLAKRNASEAVKVIDRAEQIAATAEQRKTLYLLRTHATVDIGKTGTASELLRKSATIIPFESYLQKHLARELKTRIDIASGGIDLNNTDLQKNTAEILQLETQLVTKIATAHPRGHRRAA